MRGKKWPPADVERGLQALAESGGSVTAASKATGIPKTTLWGWKTQHPDEFEQLRMEKRGSLIEKVWGAAEDALDLLIKELPKMKGRYLATTFGILTDKGLLLGGEPTEIMKELPQIVFRGVDMTEYEEREQE